MNKVIESIRNNWYWIISFVALLSSKLVIIQLFGSPIPFWDQWDGEALTILKPIADGSISAVNFLYPHNEHYLVTNRIWTTLIFILDGFKWDILLEMRLNAVLHSAVLITALALFSSTSSVKVKKIFVFAATLNLMIPVGWENTLHGFSSHFYFYILFTLLGLALISTHKGLSFKWWIGVLYCVISFFSLASGILTLAAGAIINGWKWMFTSQRSWKEFLAAIILFGLAILGFLITPTIEQHVIYRPESIISWLTSFSKAIAWPYPTPIIILYIPSGYFMIKLISKPSETQAWHLFTLGTIASLVPSFGIIAFGRGFAILSSRYTDLYMLSLIMNFSIFAYYFSERQLRHVALYGWIGVFLFSGAIMARQAAFGVEHRYTTSLIQYENTLRYLCEDDLSYLLNKPSEHIPYPDALILKQRLDDPTIRRLLPYEINPAINPTFCEK